MAVGAVESPSDREPNSVGAERPFVAEFPYDNLAWTGSFAAARGLWSDPSIAMSVISRPTIRSYANTALAATFLKTPVSMQRL